MVIAFWTIFLWGQNNPNVGDAIVVIGIVGITLIIILLTKKILNFIIANSN
jgi:hypothetical protein